MKRIHFDVPTAGFHGVYWENPVQTDACLIMMLGDDSEDYLAKTGAKWIQQQGLNVLTMSPNKKDYGHHNYPLERYEAAIQWLRANGNNKLGIVGASTTGTLALTVASYFPALTLTIAMTPSDFIWQGFAQGKRDGCKEWPIENESLFTYRGNPLPYMPFVYQHPDYWQVIKAESKKHGDMINSKKLFDDSEKAHPLTEAELIKVENIKGKLLLIGAKDDCLWDTAKYITRIEERLNRIPNDCDCEAVIYEHATHFVFPESMIKMLFPIGSALLIKQCFSAAKQYPSECLYARKDIDRILKRTIRSWMEE